MKGPPAWPAPRLACTSVSRWQRKPALSRYTGREAPCPARLNVTAHLEHGRRRPTPAQAPTTKSHESGRAALPLEQTGHAVVRRASERFPTAQTSSTEDLGCPYLLNIAAHHALASMHDVRKHARDPPGVVLGGRADVGCTFVRLGTTTGVDPRLRGPCTGRHAGARALTLRTHARCCLSRRAAGKRLPRTHRPQLLGPAAWAAA